MKYKLIPMKIDYLIKKIRYYLKAKKKKNT